MASSSFSKAASRLSRRDRSRPSSSARACASLAPPDAAAFSGASFIPSPLRSRSLPGILEASLEPPAARSGVISAAPAHGHPQPTVGEPLHESIDDGLLGSLPSGEIDRILVEGYHVDLHGNARDLPGKLRCVLSRVIDAGNQNILDGDAPPRLQRPSAHRGKDSGKRVSPRDRHEKGSL